MGACKADACCWLPPAPWTAGVRRTLDPRAPGSLPSTQGRIACPRRYLFVTGVGGPASAQALQLGTREEALANAAILLSAVEDLPAPLPPPPRQPAPAPRPPPAQQAGSPPPPQLAKRPPPPQSVPRSPPPPAAASRVTLQPGNIIQVLYISPLANPGAALGCGMVVACLGGGVSIAAASAAVLLLPPPPPPPTPLPLQFTVETCLACFCRPQPAPLQRLARPSRQRAQHQGPCGPHSKHAPGVHARWRQTTLPRDSQRHALN